MFGRTAPGVRPTGSVLLRALAAGSILGAVAAALLLVGDGSDLGGLAYLAGVLLYACPLAGGLAVLSATTWLVAAHRNPGHWVADVAAGAVAAAPFVVLFADYRTILLAVIALAVGLVAAVVARWQGCERDPRPRARLRPRSSPHAG